MNKTDKAILTGIKPLRDVESGTPDPPFLQEHPKDRPSETVSTTSLAGKSLAIHALTIVAGALIVFYLLFALHQLLGAQSLYEAVQQQRILNQRFVKEVLLAASGVPVNYEKTSREWSQATDLLVRGGVLQVAENRASQKVQPPADSTRFKVSLDRMISLRQQITQESTSYLQSARQDSHREQLFDELYRQSLQLQAAGDALVQTYDKHLDSGVSWWDVNAVAIEMAERQRMLIQQHIKEVLFVAHGIPADYQSTRLRLYESAKILMEGGQILVGSGGGIVIPAPGSSDVRFSLEQQKNALDQFTAVSNQYLMLANESVERSIQLKRISDLTSDYHEAATALLTQYRNYFEGRVKKAGREASAAGVLAAVFGLLVGWVFMRKYVDVPVGQMTAAIRAFRIGAKQPFSPAASAPGPLGEMSSEFNQCISQWKSRQTWFDQFLASNSADGIADPGSEDPIASRVYQWYKSRGSEQIAPRWNNDEKTDSDITIVGRLPDNASPINDSELLDQLIERANELQFQHEQLSRTHGRLMEEAATLRASEALLQESKIEILAENEHLRSENSAAIAQINSQLLEMTQLRGRLEGLQRSESAIVSGTEDIRRVNEELLVSLDRQSDELRVLRGQLQAKARELEIALKDGRKAGDESQKAIGDLNQRLAEAEALQSKLEAELTARARVHEEARALGLRELEIARSHHASALQSAAEIGLEFGAAQQRIVAGETLRSKLEAELTALTQAHEEARGLSLRELETAKAQHTAVLQSTAELRAQLVLAQREADEMRANTRRDQEIIANLRGLLDEAERCLLDLRATLERSLESARMDSEAREALAQRVLLLSDSQSKLEALGTEQLRQIHRQETVIVELQEALAGQTRAVEAVRMELSEALLQHAQEVERREIRMCQSEKDLSETRSQFLDAQTHLRDTRSQLVEAKTLLENHESDLWRARKELADRQRELSDARQEIERLRSVESQQATIISEMRHEAARLNSLIASKMNALNDLEEKRRGLENKIAEAEADHLEIRRRLEADLSSSREEYQGKCQALSLSEERLFATRNALKSAIDELQERSSR